MARTPIANGKKARAAASTVLNIVSLEAMDLTEKRSVAGVVLEFLAEVNAYIAG